MLSREHSTENGGYTASSGGLWRIASSSVHPTSPSMLEAVKGKPIRLIVPTLLVVAPALADAATEVRGAIFFHARCTAAIDANFTNGESELGLTVKRRPPPTPQSHSQRAVGQEENRTQGSPKMEIS